MSKPGYIIVEAPDIAHLRGYVNDAIQNGYVPVGGAQVVREYGDDGYGYKGYCIQAMVLRDVIK